MIKLPDTPNHTLLVVSFSTHVHVKVKRDPSHQCPVTTGNGHRLKYKIFNSELRKSNYCEHGQVLEKVSQACCRASILTRYSKHNWTEPPQLWAGELDYMISRGSFQPQKFCDSMIIQLLISGFWPMSHSKFPPEHLHFSQNTQSIWKYFKLSVADLSQMDFQQLLVM